MNRLKRFAHGRSKAITRQNIYEFIDSQLSEAKAGDRLLNVGSGGDVEKTVRRRQSIHGFDVVSLDISADRQPDIVADISTFRPHERFDYVVMAEVLEHIPEPHRAISNVFEILSEGGTLILTTPFLYPLHDRPHDYYRYTKYGLRYLLRNFVEHTINERAGWVETLHAIQVRVLKEETPNRVLRFMMGFWAILFYPLATFLSNSMKTDYATSGYLVVCKKSKAGHSDE